MNNKFKIKDFGDSRVCDSIKSLQETLKADYDNKSVSIHVTKSNGMIRVYYVDVKNGGVYNSYKDNMLFNFNNILNLEK